MIICKPKLLFSRHFSAAVWITIHGTDLLPRTHFCDSISKSTAGIILQTSSPLFLKNNSITIQAVHNKTRAFLRDNFPHTYRFPDNYNSISHLFSLLLCLSPSTYNVIINIIIIYHQNHHNHHPHT